MMVENMRRLVFDVRQIRRRNAFAEIDLAILARYEQQRLMRRDAFVQADHLAQHQEMITGLGNTVRTAAD